MEQPDTIGRFGYITEYDPERHYARVEFPDIGIVSAWLPVGIPNSKANKDEYPLDIGEHVYCLLHDNTGIILCSVYDAEALPVKKNANVRSTVFEDGSVFMYDRENHVLDIDIQGDINIHATGSLNIAISENTEASTGSHMGFSAARIDLN